VLKRAKFPAIKTFDSSRTPEEGEAQAAVALADVDLSEIRKQFAVAREKIAADDPEALRARIAELEARPSEPSIDAEQLHHEHVRGKARRLRRRDRGPRAVHRSAADPAHRARRAARRPGRGPRQVAEPIRE
jgi:hypothetical protein